MAEAAEILGISAEAVRGRIRRRTLPVEREGGAVYVLLGTTTGDRPTADQPRTTADQSADRTALVDALREQISDLRGQLAEANAANKENRRIIAGLIQRVPELEAASQDEPQEGRQEAAESPRRASDGQDASETRAGRQEPAQGQEARPWWRRMFGG